MNSDTQNSQKEQAEQKKFKILSDSFEGPFEKLLLLIEKKKLEITEVSLAQVTDDFVQYVKENSEKGTYNFKETAAFVQTAAILLLIKSKSLIPAFALNEEEEEDIHDLQKKLKIYKIFSDLSLALSSQFFQSILYKKKVIKKVDIQFRPSDNLTFDQIFKSLDDILYIAPKKEEYEKKEIENQMTLSEVISNIGQRIKTFLKANFNELAIGKSPKEVSVSFLAVLELFRQDEIHLSQDEAFGDIFVESKTVD